MRNCQLREALRLLQRAFIISRKVKVVAYDHSNPYHTKVDYGVRDGMYRRKAEHINAAICLIRKRSLPIKYGQQTEVDEETGKEVSIVYFEYGGEQVSFHNPHGDIIPCKPFKGEWIGVPQKKSPLARFLSAPCAPGVANATPPLPPRRRRRCAAQAAPTKSQQPKRRRRKVPRPAGIAAR